MKRRLADEHGRFAALVESLLDEPARVFRADVDMEPRAETRQVSTAEATILIHARVPTGERTRPSLKVRHGWCCGRG